MSLFKKNPNETAFVEGKKHFTDIIKNTGPGELLLWRQPEEDFNTNSTLIVMPGEQAIFINNGKVEQVFESGTYKLTTDNYPFISRLRNQLSGGISAFHCVVYFVRTAHSVEIKWGTDSPIQVRDKVYNIVTKLRARGSYKVQIENPAMFLEKLVGNNVFLTTQEELNNYFVTEFQSKIKSVIAKVISESCDEIVGIDAYLDDFSKLIEPEINKTLTEYGLKCIKFIIGAIDIDDDGKRDQFDQITIDSQRIRQTSGAATYAKKDAMDILGKNWGKQQIADTMLGIANNPGAGGLAAAGAGMGMGMAAGNLFGNMVNQILDPLESDNQEKEEKNSQEFNQNNSRFAPKQTAEDPMETLGKLKQLLDAGLIEQSEYDAKKAEILGRM